MLWGGGFLVAVWGTYLVTNALCSVVDIVEKVLIRENTQLAILSHMWALIWYRISGINTAELLFQAGIDPAPCMIFTD